MSHVYYVWMLQVRGSRAAGGGGGGGAPRARTHTGVAATRTVVTKRGDPF